MLMRAGMTVLDASSPEEALQLVGRFTGVIDLLLTDVVLSRHSGPELASRLQVLFPAIQVVYMSGYGREGGGHRSPPRDAVFLQKPFLPEELIDTISVIFRKSPRTNTKGEPSVVFRLGQTIPFEAGRP